MSPLQAKEELAIKWQMGGANNIVIALTTSRSVSSRGN
ncbi:MAG: hypothetical protein ACJAT7_000276 [Psychromonas sp.]|jgi:hypothetical protein